MVPNYITSSYFRDKTYIIDKLIILALKVGVHFWIDEEIWLKFKKYCLEKHGKFHAVLGEEVGKALLEYLENAHTHLQQEECIDDMHREVESKSRVAKDIPKIVSAIAEVCDVGGKIPHNMLAGIIRKVTSVSDARSIGNRIGLLLAYGVLERDWETSKKGNVYIVRKTYISIGRPIHDTSNTRRL